MRKARNVYEVPDRACGSLEVNRRPIFHHKHIHIPSSCPVDVILQGTTKEAAILKPFTRDKFPSYQARAESADSEGMQYMMYTNR